MVYTENTIANKRKLSHYQLRVDSFNMKKNIAKWSIPLQLLLERFLNA